MKKVAYISNFYAIPPLKGAAVQTWTNEVAKRLWFYEPHTICIDDEFLPLKEYRDGVYHHRIRLSKIYKRIFQKILGWDVYSYNDRVFNEVKKINPDIVHFQNYHNGIESLARKIKTWNKDIKVILHLHNFYDFKNKNFDKLDAVITCSDFLMKNFEYLPNAKFYKVIKNGVDVDKFKKINFKKDEKIIIGFIGRIVSQKNVEYMIELAREFKNLPEYNFKIIGEIIKRKDNYEYYKSLVKKIKEYNLNNIEFLDNISPDKVHAAYNDFDFTIIPLNDKESFCMVGIEAMSCESFVIARASEGSKEYMVDNENCKLFDFDNFAKKVKEYILNLKYPERHRIISNARKMCEENFSWNKIAEDTQIIYEEILNDASK